MAKTTPIDKMDAALEQILTDYGEYVNDELQAVIKKAAQKGRAALKSSSPRSGGNGSWQGKHYGDNWAVKDTTSRLTISDIIYNKAPTYRLAHLLELRASRVPAPLHHTAALLTNCLTLSHSLVHLYSFLYPLFSLFS